MGRADHGREIAAKFPGIADVQRQQVEQVVAQAAGLGELDRRNAYSLLPDFGGGGIVAAMGRAADIALMGANDGPQEALVAVEDRYECGQVGQMAAAMIGIVQQNDVAPPNVT